MSYHGDIALGDTIDIKFCTVNTSGVPTALAGTPVVSAYPDNSLTQLTAGITLTVDFDALTGLNNVRVVATGANGYAAASNYELVITTGTVGGSSVVGYVVGSFSIENRIPVRAASVLPAGAHLQLGIQDSGTAAAIANGTITLRAGHGLASATSYMVELVAGTTAVGKSRIISYSGTGDVFNVDPAWNAGGETLPSGTIKYIVRALPPAPTSAVPAVDIAKVNGVTIVAPDQAGYLKVTVASTGTGSISPPTNFSLLSIDASGRTDVIKVAGTTQTARDLGAQLDAAITTRAASSVLGAASGGVSIADDIAKVAENLIRRATAQAGAAGTITLDTAANATNDYYNGGVIVLVSGTGAAQARLITDYVGATKVASVEPNWVTNPDATSVFRIIANAERLGEIIEGTTSARQSLRLANAANGGKASGMATTTAVLRDLADSKNRVSATVDADGNRTAVTLDLT